MSILRNKSHKELLHLSKSIVQPLISQLHKGQSGRIAIIGGCEDYTGAPFFASHSAALIGCDLTHVICEKNAAPVIKSYSPDLMVHPYLLDSSNINSNDVDSTIESRILSKVVPLLERMNAVVVGPGFGRDPVMVATLIKIIQQVKVLNLPIILDADALYLISKDYSLIQNYPKAVLTPNVVEFNRIAKSLGEQIPDQTVGNIDADIDFTMKISRKLGGVTIVRKGMKEIIVKDDLYVVNETPGSNKRVGGQGDTLAGALSIFITWASNYQSGLWTQPQMSAKESVILACFGASSLVRVAAAMAFAKYGRSMQTSNLHQFLGDAYQQLYGKD